MTVHLSDGQVVIVAGGGEAVAALIDREASEGLPEGFLQIWNRSWTRALGQAGDKTCGRIPKFGNDPKNPLIGRAPYYGLPFCHIQPEISALLTD
ncbi:hypothetical protein [Methylobacterium segetis]|uniref:hypothetical protein n=1 Tax=Methylobacterium segetis TaxID=2488750 RepID=UPI0010485533|nr:hypothetical protein [Methylobacterium segetis]